VQEDLVEQLEGMQIMDEEEGEDDDELDGSDIEDLDNEDEKEEGKENEKPLDISKDSDLTTKDSEKTLNDSGSQARLNSSERNRDSLSNIGIIGTSFNNNNLNKDNIEVERNNKSSNKMDKHGRPPMPDRDRVDRFNERD
jgi:hypothetical protein